MGDRKTDAAESLEDRVCLDMDKMEKDMFKYDKGIDIASSTAIAQGLTNAGVAMHEITQNTIFKSHLIDLMEIASYSMFLKQLMGVDVQAILESALMKAAGDAMAGAVPKAEPEVEKK